MNNRQTRRAASTLFKKQVQSGRWGDWVEELTPSRLEKARECGLSGMKRFVANERYSVQFFEQSSRWGKITHLLIRRHDQGKGLPWAHKQRIKNELVGEDRTAVEVFPSAKNLIDDADVYHLWVLPPDFDLPFGIHRQGWSR